MESVDLLLADNAQDAARLAAQLNNVNQQRRALQQAIEEAVHERIARQYAGQPPAALVLGDPDWHLGVVGIVAARIAETYHRPTFLLQIDGHTARGSGRSIPAFDLYQGLHQCARWLQRFGGHQYAAGLTMDVAQLPYLQEDFIRLAEDTLTPEDLRPTLQLDALATLAELTPALLEQLASFAPHGAANPVPLFCAQGVQIAATPRTMGLAGEHIRFRAVQGTAAVESVAFHLAHEVLALANTGLVDLAFTPTLNTWRGRRAVELHVRALRPHTPQAARTAY
jgi:single-stranded-DNA-specific exonuclease